MRIVDIQNNTPPHQQRDSNFELLRLLSMMMILALHANHQSLGEPTTAAAIASPLQMFARELIQQLCVVGVNVFVLISGWFGIRPKRSSFFSLMFQVVFYSVGLFVVMYALGERLPFLKTIQLFWFGAGYWFVPAYIMLYALSPVLNSFIEHAERSTIKTFIIIFYSLQLLYGWAFDDFANFDGGYSAISFVGLYILARYLRIYRPSYTGYSKGKLLAIYLGVCVLGGLISLGSLLSGVGFLAEHFFGKMQIYTSPFVIIPSVSLILLFDKIQIQSKIINWLAVSCFAIYLIHQHWMVRPYFWEVCRYVFNNYSGLSYFLVIIPFLLAVGLACILFDKLRIVCWSAIENKCFSDKKNRNKK